MNSGLGGAPGRHPTARGAGRRPTPSARRGGALEAASRPCPRALATLALLLALCGSARAVKTMEGQTTFWDRIMQAQSQRSLRTGSEHFEGKRYGDAVREFSRAVVSDPSDAQAHQLLGVAYYWSGRVDEAEAEFRESLRLKSDTAQTHLLLGIVHAWRGKLEDAYAAFQEAARLDPARADIQMNLGSIEESLGMHPKALEHFRKAVTLDPGHALYHYQLGMLYKRLGREEEALEEFKLAVKRFGAYQEAWLELGALYERLGNVDGAVEAFHRAVRLKERDSVARFRLARVYANSGRAARAREALEGVFHLTPENASGGLALSLSYGGRAEEGAAERAPEPSGAEASGPEHSLDVLARNLSRIPLDQEATLQVDMAFLPKPRLERKGSESSSALKDALEKAGGSSANAPSGASRQYHFQQGDAATRREELARAVSELRALLERAPRDAEVRMAMNLQYAPRAASASSAAQKSKVSYQPHDVGNDLGLWVMGTGWMGLVEDVLGPSQDSERPPLGRVLSGVGYSILGDARRAREAFKAALAENPGEELAHLGLGVAMVISGDETRAAEAYRRALELNPANKSAAQGLRWLSRSSVLERKEAP